MARVVDENKLVHNCKRGSYICLTKHSRRSIWLNQLKWKVRNLREKYQEEICWNTVQLQRLPQERLHYLKGFQCDLPIWHHRFRIPEVAGTTPFDPVFIIYQSGTSYVGSPTSLYSALSQQSNSTPDLAALVKACWDNMTANSVYGKIIIMPGTNAYLWATSIAPISNMALVGHSNSEWFTGSAGPATVIKIANGLNNYAFKWVGHIHNGESGLSLPGWSRSHPAKAGELATILTRRIPVLPATISTAPYSSNWIFLILKESSSPIRHPDS